MPETECCWWCIKHCRPKAGKFWNNFCRSSAPLSYVILGLVLMNLIHWVYFAASANNFGALSHFQYVGYVFTCCSGLLLFAFALFAIHALNVHWPTRLRVIFIEFGLILALILMACSIATYFYTPTKEEMRDHVYEYYVTYGRNPVIMNKIESEKKCCGIFSIWDYVDAGKDNVYEGIRLPLSCCKRKIGRCGDRTEKGYHGHREGQIHTVVIEDITELDNFNKKGCVLKGYWDLRHSAKDSFSEWTTYFLCTIFHCLSCVTILVIFNYYICYKFPSQRNKSKAINQKIKSIYKERDGVIEEATSTLELAEYAIEGPAILEWYNMHYLPKWGAYGNIDRIARDGFTLPKKYEFPLFPFDLYKAHPESFKVGTNLDMYEGKEVYESPPPEKSDDENIIANEENT